jgi:hypothetical protein
MKNLLYWLDLLFLGTTSTTAERCPKCGKLAVFGKENEKVCTACGAHQKPMARGLILMPVVGRQGCVGHLLNTCRGWRACDPEGRTLGYYPTPADAALALAGRLQPTPTKPKRARR